MAFRIKHGSLETITKLAKLTGEAIQGEKKQRLALDLAMRIGEQKRQAEMAEFNVMMQMEARKQQMQWEYEKIQIAQQNDFTHSEQLRMQQKELDIQKQQRRESQFEATIKAIEDSEILNNSEKDRLKTNAAMKHNMGPYAPQIKEPKPITAGAALKEQRGLEDDVTHYQDIINRYSDTRDISWWPAHAGRGAGDLAYKNEDDQWVPATEQDKAIYDYAKSQLALKMQMLNLGGLGPGGMAGGPGDVLGLGGI